MGVSPECTGILFRKPERLSKQHPIRAFVMQFIRAAIAAITVVLISRWLGAAQRGELSLLLFYVQLIMVANEFAGGSSLGNLVVKYPLNRLFPFSKIWALLVCIIGCGLYAIFTDTPQNTLYVAVLAFPLSWLSIHYNLYQGFAMVHTRNVLQLLLEICRLLAVFALAFLGVQLVVQGDIPSIWSDKELLQWDTVMVVYGVTAFGILIISTAVLRKKLMIGMAGSWRPQKELLTTGFWAQNGQLVQFLNYRLSLVLLTYFLVDRSYAGIYSNALLIADTIWIFGNSFGTIAHMRMLQSENPTFRADITLRYAAVSVLGTALACAVLLLIPNGFYVQIFGSDFYELRQSVVYLIPAILALGASTLFSHYLHATNQFKALLLANASGLVLQVVLALVLIPEYGLTGACLAADAGFVLIFIVVFALFKRQNPGAHLHGKFRIGAIWQTLTKSEW
jgi:O-antigen/teichoic acid export membrane protein